MEDIIQPVKLDPNSYATAVRCGLASRYISCNRPANDVLLSKDLMNMAVESTLASSCGANKSTYKILQILQSLHLP